MNRELDTFLYVVRNMLADQHTELASLSKMTKEQIQAFGAEEYHRDVHAKLEFIGVFSDFVVKSAVLLNEGKSLGEVLANMMIRSDNTYDRAFIANTQLCCQAILDEYFYIDIDKLLG